MKLFSGIRTGVGLVVVSGLLSTSAFALTTSESETLTKSITTARVADLPSMAAKTVSKASKEDRDAVAAAVISATGLSHPSALVSTAAAIVKKTPEASVAVINAALEVAPDQASLVVAALVKAAPTQAERVVLAASKKAPSKAASFEREVASVRKARSVSASSTIFGGSGDVNQNPTPIGTVPVNLYAQPGADPERP
jgi:hypothetical protein